MLIPNAERALVDIRKLRDYCLNPTHPEGKHKARLFAAALGMTVHDAQNLRSELLQIVKTHDATVGRRDVYGQRYLIDFLLEWHGHDPQRVDYRMGLGHATLDHVLSFVELRSDLWPTISNSLMW